VQPGPGLADNSSVLRLRALAGCVVATAVLVAVVTPGRASAAQPPVSKAVVTAIGKLQQDLFKWHEQEVFTQAPGPIGAQLGKKRAALDIAANNTYNSMETFDPAVGGPDNGAPQAQYLYALFDQTQANDVIETSSECPNQELATKCLAAGMTLLQKDWKVLDNYWSAVIPIVSHADAPAKSITATVRQIYKLHNIDLLVSGQLKILQTAANSVLKAPAKKPVKYG
jgi:hypothetical protein